MIHKYIVIISFFLLSPSLVFGATFENIGNSTLHATYSGGVYICNEPSAVNFTETSSDPSPCVFAPPTMFEVLTINSIIVAFASMIYLIRLFTDNKIKTSKYL